jgi:peptide/nickel transport system substrate-binding protein
VTFGLTNGTRANYSDIIPVLATNWTESSNGLNYTFNLRNGVYYSNGDQFNAYVVWYNVYRGMLMNVGIAPGFDEIDMNDSGVTVNELNELNNSQNLPPSNLTSVLENQSNAVTVPNATTVEFHLQNVYPGFMSLLTGIPNQFVDPHVVEMNGGVVANTPNSYMSVNGTLVGDGPYITSSVAPNQYVILQANPDYWAQNVTGNYYIQPAKINQIVIDYKQDELTRTEDLETNKAQVAVVYFNDVNLTEAADRDLFVPQVGPSGVIEFVQFDEYLTPMNNTYLRQALVAAVNVSEIISAVYQNNIVPFVGPDPYGYPGYNYSISPSPYNLTLAKALLAEAGYPGGKGLPPLTFDYTGSYVEDIATVLQADFAAIGVTLQPKDISFNTWVSLLFASGGNSSGASESDLMYGNLVNWPDFAGYNLLVIASGPNIDPFPTNQTISNVALESNSQNNPQLRAEEISDTTLWTQQQAAAIWLGTDQNIFNVGAGFGPMLFNKCVAGMYYDPVVEGIGYNTLYYTCNPAS